MHLLPVCQPARLEQGDLAVADGVTLRLHEAKGILSELVRDSDSEGVLLMRHGRPATVLMSVERHAALMEELDDLEDRLSVHEREGLTMLADKVAAELGLNT